VAVKVAHQLGVKVVPLVGPSSILLALMGSGFSGQSFVFHGYLPIDKIERAKKIKTLESESRKQQTQIFMETPFRNDSFLEDLLNTCNITAPDELIQTKTINQWKSKKPDLHKKPTMFLIG
jgi:16S rRNA (cytidine1402-2'-O)-methyltransferase